MTSKQEKEARKTLKMAYLEKLFDDGLLNTNNLIAAAIKIDQMVDNLVSVQEGNTITFYGIDGQPNDPNNMAAVLIMDDDE